MHFRSIVSWFKVGHRASIAFSALVVLTLVIIDPSLHTVHNLYSSMWSNMWAPSIWTLGGILIADLRSVRRNKQMKLHHTTTTSDLAGQIESLADRLVSLIGGNDGDK